MIEGIQYLRAIAALMVVAHHARHFFGGNLPGWSEFGATGVDVFFVISGFVIAHASRHFDPQAPRVPQVGDFLVRRAIRVIPLYWLALALAAQYLVRKTDLGLLLDFAFLPRHHPTQKAFVAPALMPGWTINYEIFFYMLFAMSMAFGAQRYRVLLVSMGALVFAGWALPSDSIVWRFYTSPLLLEFLVGVGIQFSHNRRVVIPRPVAVGLLVLGFIGLAQTSVWSGFAAAAVVLGAIHACRGWSSPPLRLIGDASYSIYLSHLFSFVLIGKLCRAIGFGTPDAVSIGAVIALHVLLATLAGIAVHFVVERPLIALSRHVWERLGKLVAPPVPS